jgi:predicted rRNA methylase YqxC with S4 and FtsJ domains
VEEVNNAARALGLDVINVIESPIQGAEGNVEYLALYRIKPQIFADER